MFKKVFLLIIFVIMISCSNKSPEIIPLWPGRIPGKRAAEPEKLESSEGVLRAFNVSTPSIQVYTPRGGKNGSAVMICPGGGYNILAMDKEGSEIAEWFNRLGVTAFVLKYRVPDNRDGALMDAQRAMRYIRYQAGRWEIDPGKIGIIGFSAAGNVAARLCSSFKKGNYPPSGEADMESFRPDFAMLIYAAWLIDDDLNLAPDIEVTARNPPTFLVHAEDDWIPVETSIKYNAALKEAGVPSELHVFPDGGHGYGIRPSNKTVSVWPRRCEAWLRQLEIIK